MKVLRLTPFFYHDAPDGWDPRYDPLGGMQIQIYQASLWLAERGVRQQVLTLGFPGLPAHASPHPNLHVRVARLPLPEIRSEITGLVGLVPSWFLACLRQLLPGGAGRRFTPDLIHAHADGLIYPLLLGRIASKLLGAPLVLTIHCSRLAVYQPMSSFDRLAHGATCAAEEASVRCAAAVVTLTGRTARLIAEKVPGAAEKIADVPDVVKSEEFGGGEDCEAGRRWVGDTFGPDSVLPRLLSIYERIRPANPSQFRPDA
jgi:2-deoxystreptamine N-acetyl-D-glucosaminyltransferase/2-deoxystreptamine glucosyltransferase